MDDWKNLPDHDRVISHHPDGIVLKLLQKKSCAARVKSAKITSKDGVGLARPAELTLSNAGSCDPRGYWISEGGLFVLATEPTSTASVALEVYRNPMVMLDDDSEPDIPEAYHRKMLFWAMKLAYQRPHEDTYDKAASDRYDAEFTRTFGPPKTAQQHRQRRRNSARSIKTPGY